MGEIGRDSSDLTLRSSPGHRIVALGVVLAAWVSIVLGTLNEPTGWLETVQSVPLFYVLFFIGPLVYFFNVWFRTIRFTEKRIEVKRWYWPTRVYSYDEVISIEANTEKTMKIYFENGVIRIPEYLLTCHNGTRLYGLDVASLLQARCKREIPVELTH